MRRIQRPQFKVFYLAPRMLGGQWFEKDVFAWGWLIGTVLMGILLLRIADLNRKIKILDDCASVYAPESNAKSVH